MPCDGELYNVLGVDRNASPDDIKKAFRRKAIQCHPDKHPGDKTKEEEFKRINEAYMVLSDIEKRKRYDLFGEVDDMPQGGGPNMADLSDLFAGMFGGGGGPGSFFSFGGNMGDANIFEHMFGAGGGHGASRPADVIDIPVDICDLYYGRTRKVEFELLELCGKCNGTGASDPSAIIKCMTCDGRGNVMQQIGPFMMQSSRCPNCGGKGTTVRNNKICHGCKGQRTLFSKRMFELKIPPGIPNMYDIRMDGKGSYDERIKCAKDIVFRFKYDIKAPYEILKNDNVQITLPLTIEDVLAGFSKKVKIYNEEFDVFSEAYFNPQKPFIIPGLGLPSIEDPKKHGDLIIKFTVDFSDNDKLKKHNPLLRKMLRRDLNPETSKETSLQDRVICIT